MSTETWTDQPSLADEQSLERAKDAIAGDMPIMRAADDPVVHLYRGIHSPTDGRFHTDAVVRELTGSDEEAIARMMSSNDAVQFINAVLAHCVDSVGSRDLTSLPLVERQDLLDQLLVGEKEMLFLKVLTVTYGDERLIVLKCPMCEEENEVTFSITDDIPVKGMDDPTKILYDHTLRNGDRVEYRLVSGGDQAEAQKRKNLTLPEVNTVLLARCIVSINGKVPLDSTRFARDMGAVDRRNLLNEISDKQPGPQFKEVKLPCASCGAEASYTPSWADLLST